MPKRLLRPDEFRDEVRAKRDVTDVSVYRLATESEATTEPRVRRFKFSDESVARDGHTIATAGWKLDPYRSNPVFLWAHDMSELPIGNTILLETTGRALFGNVEYFERDIYPFADTVFQMVSRGFLRAVSVHWLPLKYRFATESNRMGGVDFLEQELLEVSQVPVPAQSTALAVASARSAGIDTGPIVEWAEKILDQARASSDPTVPKRVIEGMRSAAKMPTTPKPKPREVPMKRTLLTSTTPMARDLYDVASLAYLLNSLCYLQDGVEYEAELEGDGSDIPDRLLAVLQALGQVLVDMTVEEVAELVEAAADETIVVIEIDDYMQSLKTPAQRAVAMLGWLGAQSRARSQRRYVIETAKQISSPTLDRLRSSVSQWMNANYRTALILEPGMTLKTIEADAPPNMRALLRMLDDKLKRNIDGDIVDDETKADLTAIGALIDKITKRAPPAIVPTPDGDDAAAKRARIAAHALRLAGIE